MFVRNTVVLAAALAAFATIAPAQQSSAPFVVHTDKTPTQTAPAALTSPSNCPQPKTPAALLDALDDAISGPGTKDFACLQSLFIPGARLVPIQKLQEPTPAGLEIGMRPLTIEQYLDLAKKRQYAIYEKQTGWKSEQFGNIAEIWTTYTVSKEHGGAAVARGVNSFQAIYDGKQWKILELMWQGEGKELPLPSLPTR